MDTTITDTCITDTSAWVTRPERLKGGTYEVKEAWRAANLKFPTWPAGKAGTRGFQRGPRGLNDCISFGVYTRAIYMLRSKYCWIFPENIWHGLAKGHFRVFSRRREGHAKCSDSALGCHMKENRRTRLKMFFLTETQKFSMGNLLMSGWDERLDHWQLFYWTLSAPGGWSSDFWQIHF